MKFVLTQSLFQDTVGNLFIFNSKIVFDQETLLKTSLSVVRKFGHLGVKVTINNNV
jgi:hypothetical protein